MKIEVGNRSPGTGRRRRAPPDALPSHGGPGAARIPARSSSGDVSHAARTDAAASDHHPGSRLTSVATNAPNLEGDGRPFPPGEYPLVVVGSGPGGLQVSYSLSRLGVKHAVISADPAPGGMFCRFPF